MLCFCSFFLNSLWKSSDLIFLLCLHKWGHCPRTIICLFMGMDLERTHGQTTVRYGGITVVSHKVVVFNCAKIWQINCVRKSTLPHFSILVCQFVLANSNEVYCSTRSVSINYQYQNGGPPFLRVFENELYIFILPPYYLAN